jgi:hypothetical protein
MKHFNILPSFCLAAILFCAPAWAQRAVTASVAGNQINGTGTVTISLTSQGNENALGFSLVFDPAVLRYDSYANGADLNGATLIVNPTQPAAGRIGVALALAAGSQFSAGNRELLRLSFSVVAPASTSANLTFGNTPVGREVSDPAAETLAATFSGATVTVVPAPALLIVEPSPLPSGRVRASPLRPMRVIISRGGATETPLRRARWWCLRAVRLTRRRSQRCRSPLSRHR